MAWSEKWFFTRDGDVVVLRGRFEADDGTIGDAFKVRSARRLSLSSASLPRRSEDFDCIVLRDIAARDYLGRNAAITNTLRAVGVQGKTKPGQILISPCVLMAVEDAVTVEPVGEFALKGIRRPLAAYNVLATKSAN